MKRAVPATRLFTTAIRAPRWPAPAAGPCRISRDRSRTPARVCPIACFETDNLPSSRTTVRERPRYMAHKYAEVLRGLEHARSCVSVRDRRFSLSDTNQLLRGHEQLGHVAGLRTAPRDGAESPGGRDLSLLSCEPRAGGEEGNVQWVWRRRVSAERRQLRTVPRPRQQSRERWRIDGQSGETDG